MISQDFEQYGNVPTPEVYPDEIDPAIPCRRQQAHIKCPFCHYSNNEAQFGLAELDKNEDPGCEYEDVVNGVSDYDLRVWEDEEDVD